MFSGGKQNKSFVYSLPDYQTEVKSCDVTLQGSPCFQLSRTRYEPVVIEGWERVYPPLP